MGQGLRFCVCVLQCAEVGQRGHKAPGLPQPSIPIPKEAVEALVSESRQQLEEDFKAREAALREKQEAEAVEAERRAEAESRRLAKQVAANMREEQMKRLDALRQQQEAAAQEASEQDLKTLFRPGLGKGGWWGAGMGVGGHDGDIGG